MTKFDHAGGGRYDIWKPRKENPWPVIITIGVILWIIIAANSGG